MIGQPGRLADLDATALDRMRLGGSAETVPRLTDLMQVMGPDTPLLIEMKPADDELSGADDGLAVAVAAAIAGHTGQLAVMSFDPAPIARMAKLAPAIPRGLVTCDFPKQEWPLLPRQRAARLAAIPDYAAVGASFISHDARAIDMPRVAELKAAGAAVLCWTIRSPADEARARRIADGITFEGYLPELPRP
jgi:glycerophosphoryl diester phosphodiesterase